MDNGDDKDFYIHMKEYAENHGNLLKFVNHRTKLVPGALKFLVSLKDFINPEI